MTLNLTIPQQNHSDFTPRITVIGVGGGGTNAVDNMIHSQLQGVEFVVANTDAQQLSHSSADRRIQLGPHLTQGLGAGAKPEIGRAAAEEACDELSRHLDGAHMVFITAGMGGGTGTGAAPVIARMARERGILTVGVVTKPFTFEGGRRAKSADAGIAELQQFVDTLIVIPNQNLFRLANERTSWKDAFKMADNVLYMGVRGVTDLMMAPGLVNLDFADIRTIMAEMGKAMMGTGEAEGENRAIAAAEDAISNPLLEDTSMAGAQGLLINITGGEDLTLFEVDQAANRIREEVAEDANIIFGSAIDTSLNGRIRVSVVATGIDNPPSRATAQPPQQPAEAVASAATPAAAPQAATPVPGAAGATPPAAPATPAGQPAAATEQAARPAPSPDAVPPQVAQAQRGSPRSPLFTESAKAPAPEPQQPAPRSLFGIVTGALRRHSTPPQPEAAPRAEPSVQQQTPPQQPQPEQAAAGGAATPDDGGLDIPAFLRRRSS
ncbi:hypothetical protein JCM25156A_03360 [Komagataeibacter kakiaceti JCM 25156]